MILLEGITLDLFTHEILIKEAPRILHMDCMHNPFDRKTNARNGTLQGPSSIDFCLRRMHVFLICHLFIIKIDAIP